MSDEDRMRSEIARMQMRGDELTDQVITLVLIILNAVTVGRLLNTKTNR